MSIQRIQLENKAEVEQFFKEQWGSAQMIISTGIYNCAELEGYIYREKGEIIALLTYVMRDGEIEIISLDSIKEGRGIGSKLMENIEQDAKEKGIHKIKLITTNDNLRALKFYQKRGYRIVNIFPDAVTNSRKMKPSIPHIGNEGIPLMDELLLEKRFV